MNSSVPVTFRCVCDTAHPVPSITDEQAWTCPGCTRRWRADTESVCAVVAGAAVLRRLQRAIVLAAVVTAVAVAVLAVVHPPWLINVPILLGGVALLARPTYRKQLQRGRTALRTPIGVVAA